MTDPTAREIEAVAKALVNRITPSSYDGMDPVIRRLWNTHALAAILAHRSVLAEMGMRVVPAEPTAEIIARTLPQTDAPHDPVSQRLAEESVFLASGGVCDRMGVECALALIGDYRAMIAATEPKP